MVLSCTSKDRTTISQYRHARSYKKKKKKRAGGKRPNWDACTASNVCCLLAWLHMTKYGRKKALFPVSNTHKKRKTQGFHMLCRQIEPSYSNTLTTEREWRELLSALHRANDSAMWRLSSIKLIYSQKQQDIPNALPVPKPHTNPLLHYPQLSEKKIK